MKHKIIACVILGLVAMNVQASTLPRVEAPLPQLQEGTETRLTAAQIQEILPWAKNTKSRLEELLQTVVGLRKSEAERIFISTIESVVVASSPKHSELYMRYILNRALKVHQVLQRESNLQDVGSVDMRLRLLESSVRMALTYYAVDTTVLADANNSRHASFGIAYSNFLSALSRSVYDASAQYQIERLVLGFLQWDFYRDLDNQAYASQINRIYNLLAILPEVSPTDQTSLDYIRQMKRLKGQLGLTKVDEVQGQSQGWEVGNKTIDVIYESEQTKISFNTEGELYNNCFSFFANKNLSSIDDISVRYANSRHVSKRNSSSYWNNPRILCEAVQTAAIESRRLLARDINGQMSVKVVIEFSDVKTFQGSSLYDVLAQCSSHYISYKREYDDVDISVNGGKLTSHRNSASYWHFGYVCDLVEQTVRSELK